MCGLMAAVLALAGALPQEDAAGLIQQLRSENIEVREELKKAAESKDAEVASRARHLIAVVGVREKVTARLLQAMPDLAKLLEDKADTVRMCKEAGLGLALEENAIPAELSDWLSSEKYVCRREGGTLVTALEEVVGWNPPFTLVLEPGQMRILSWEDALQFWKKWWEGAQKEKAGDK